MSIYTIYYTQQYLCIIFLIKRIDLHQRIKLVIEGSWSNQTTDPYVEMTK